MSSYASWHVGMEVVAREDAPARSVAAKQFASKSGIVSPQRGCVYTIREIVICHMTTGDEVCLRLREVVNSYTHPLMADGGEIAFSAANFRPVQKRATDISCFTRLLTHPRVTIGEDA
jgi:hypothetical protein